jgi:hypothetical protein
MPRATVNVSTTEHHDLKSLPEGFVELRRLTYGQMVQRRAMMKLSVETGKNKDFKGEMAMASEEITRFEFAHAIVDHNLEDESGRKLNLSAPVDFASLDPRVGTEIETLITKMNNFDDESDPQEV